MKKKMLLRFYFVLGLLLIISFSNLYAGSGTVTFNLLSSTNAGLVGGNIYYYYSGGWQFGGTTDGNGTVNVFIPKTTDIEIRYAGGRYKWTNIDPSVTTSLTINTVLVTVKLQTCNGAPLVGVAKYYFGGETVIGNTPATIELLPYSGLGPGQGNYDFKCTFEGRTSPWQTKDISQNPVVVFTTTKVSMYGSNVLYYNGGWQSFTSPKEMMGGTSNKYGNISWCDFKLNGMSSPTVTVNIDGCVLSGGLITLVDEAGNPLANYPADYPTEKRNLKWKYRCGGSWGPETSFQTNANGQTFCSIGCSNWDKKITVTLNQTAKEQDITINSTFQAAKVNVNLKTCSGLITDVPGGTVDQGGGYWYTHGTTGPIGKVTFYTFPATIKLRMSYNHANETQFPGIIAGTNEVDFMTTAVTMNYPYDIKSNKGGSWWLFNKPTMDLLAGNYDFWFKSGSSWLGPFTLSVSGCSMNKVLLRVIDENGNGVAGGVATPACGGSWQSSIPGQTDANGILFGDIPSCYTKIKMVVNQGGQEQTVSQLNTSNYTWYAEILRIWLKDNAGNPITDQNGILDQGGGYWYNWGNFNASGYRDIQLFPGSYKFRATYNYTSEEKFPVVSSGPGIQSFDFQTGKVVVLAGPCVTEYSSGAWRTFTDGMQLMPGTYTFRYPVQSGTVVAGSITNLSCKFGGKILGITNTDENSFVSAVVYPNPFNTSATIDFSLSKRENVSVKLYDLKGNLVNILIDQMMPEGDHKITWDGKSSYGVVVSPGMYICRLVTPTKVDQIQIVKTK